MKDIDDVFWARWSLEEDFELLWDRVTENVVDRVVQSVATKIESLVCNGQPLVLVLLGDGSVLSQTRVQLHCDVERLVRKRVIVDALVKGLVLDGVRVGGHKVGDLRLEGIPSITGEGSGDVVLLTVENLVPEGMQLVHRVVTL